MFEMKIRTIEESSPRDFDEAINKLGDTVEILWETFRVTAMPEGDGEPADWAYTVVTKVKE